MRVTTTRFGDLEITDQDLFEFKEGLLGFGHLRQFIVLDDPNDEIFAWLQSCENPDVAFPILEPGLFYDTGSIRIPKSDVEALGLESSEQGKLFCIVTIPSDPTLMTANMKAPVLLNLETRRARQCVLQDNSLEIREPIFAKLQQRVVQNPAASFKPEPEAIHAVKVQREARDAEL